MKITFDQTIEDFAAFSHYHYTKNWRLKIIRGFFLIVFLISLVLFVIQFMGRNPGDKVDIFPLILMGALNVYFLVSFSKFGFIKRTERFVRKKGNEHMVGQRDIEFNEKQILVHTALTDYNTAWQSILDLKENKDYLFLYVASNQGIIIPKRMFLLDQEQHEVKSFIERKLAEHKN